MNSVSLCLLLLVLSFGFAGDLFSEEGVDKEKEPVDDLKNYIKFSYLSGKGTEEQINAPITWLDGEGVGCTIASIGADDFDLSYSFDKEDEVEVVKLSFDPVSRLVLFQMNQKGLSRNYVKLGKSKDIRIGDPLYTNFSGEEKSLSRLVSRENWFQERILPLTLLRVHHGANILNIGTPLFDKKGRLVALCHEKTTDYGKGTYAIPVEVISRLLAEKPEDGISKRSWLGIGLQGDSPVLSIDTIAPNSPAAKSGLLAQDIIIKINGGNIQSYEEAVDSFYYLLPGKKVKFTVIRGVEKKEFELIPEVAPPIPGNSLE